MSKPPRAKYRTTNWSEYNEALKHRGSLMVWLDADLQWQAPASGRPGRPAVFSDTAIQFCLTLKCMFGLGLRQVTGPSREPDQAGPAGLGCARLQHPVAAPEDAECGPRSAGLHLLIDSTGMKMLG